MTSSTEGDIGDSVLTLSILAQINGGPHDLILRQSRVTKMKTPADVNRWHSLFAPLAESQPYIRECRVAKKDEPADWDSGGFRGTGLHSRSASLFGAQLSHLIFAKGTGHGFTADKPWLNVDPSEKTKGRVVVARSGRYRNGAFKWKEVVDYYGDKILFIGLPHEYQEFVGNFGLVEYQKTENFLDVAQLIAGSLLFIGNQSSPMTVCEGLKHPSIQETSTDPADCIYKRVNAQYCYNGAMTLPGFGEKPDLITTPVKIIAAKPPLHTAPPGQWQYKGFKAYSIDVLVNIIKASLPEENTPGLLDGVIQANVDRIPEFFMNDGAIQGYKRVEQAMVNAGYAPRDFRTIVGI